MSQKRHVLFIEWPIPFEVVRGYSNLMKLRGCGTALVTPFKLDGSLDEAALRELVRWRVESGINSGPVRHHRGNADLSHDEWLRVIDLAYSRALVLVAQWSMNNLITPGQATPSFLSVAGCESCG